ncbi:MXAN_2561 family MXYO-CTERM-anchored protein [Archangium primigenium]|uniref:MXAN_2561 family MXYO-CTERM-anchored protein n=1 Tax=[Archangium] primigenium TaxID=2792470 RepID=UPI00195C6A69|nr:MXAN_2561 family MXYO-CTERM-anchored protein [Archangium primigenium]MBM7114787.1 hypothetical protein [Archangium primigenium]
MRNFLFTVALLLSSAASAQMTLTFTTTKLDTLRFGKSGCSGGNVSMTWTRTANVCRALSLWLSADTSCDTAPRSGEVTLPDIPLTTLQTSQTGTFTVGLANLPFPTGDGGAGCGALADEKTFLVCGATGQFDSFGTSCSSTPVKSSSAKLIYDGKPPNAPGFATVAPLDRGVRVTISAPSDATQVSLVVLRDGAEVRRVPPQAVGSAPIQVGELENDVAYQLQAYAFDEAGNESAPSELVTFTPTKTFGFIEKYQEAGGQETGGCGAVGGGVAGGAVLAVLGFWLSSRRDRSWREQ